MHKHHDVDFDVREIPFSTRGSWLDLSPVVGLHRIEQDLHLVSHTTGMHGILRLVPGINGERADSVIAASASRLQWKLDRGLIEATFDGTDCYRIRGRGAELTVADASAVLTPFTGTYFFRDPIDSSAVFTSYESGRRYRITAVQGELVFEGDAVLGTGIRSVTAVGDAGWEIAIEEFETSRAPYVAGTSFDELARAAVDAFSEYAQKFAGWRDEEDDTAVRPAYVLWSATVSPAGFLRRESVLMSKHWMDKLWSWDHCFNALAFAPADSNLALDQFLAPFDFQDASGALPDSITHSEVLYNFVKPPIHGWALDRIRRIGSRAFDESELSDVYRKLARWTRFWLDARRVAGHVLPYYQHGNDSGWDNSTTFDLDRIIESPDLAAFLVLQLDTLARLSDELGTNDAATWRLEREKVLAGLIGLWDGEHFVARAVESGRGSKTSSLLNLLPIVAAEFLPSAIVDRLVSSITEHLTEWGPATQLPTTPEYEADGYWRGPIWAPSTIIIEHGLRVAGYDDLADHVSQRFRQLCQRSGFAENFDALTGAGLRDRAYTWTASAYLVLANEARKE